MQYSAKIQWKRNEAPFNAKSFDRTHMIKFGSGFLIEATASPDFLGRGDLPNPEELYTASVSSCFMLTFLHYAAAEGLLIDHYVDNAIGHLATNPEGQLMMTEIILSPKITFHQKTPVDPTLLDALFKKTHENCFIANSLRTKVIVQAQQPVLA